MSEDDTTTPPVGVGPEWVFEEMTARRKQLEGEIAIEQESVKASYAAIAVARNELKTVKRLLSAAKPRARKAKT